MTPARHVHAPVQRPIGSPSGAGYSADSLRSVAVDLSHSESLEGDSRSRQLTNINTESLLESQ